ncbi:hypothetical protein J2W57_003580 [Chryseobacterium ginsenosidimutans]|nr:hypothetical protein [Chryseobacterium ginsenosidimutans]
MYINQISFSFYNLKVFNLSIRKCRIRSSFVRMTNETVKKKEFFYITLFGHDNLYRPPQPQPYRFLKPIRFIRKPPATNLHQQLSLMGITTSVLLLSPSRPSKLHPPTLQLSDSLTRRIIPITPSFKIIDPGFQ